MSPIPSSDLYYSSLLLYLYIYRMYNTNTLSGNFSSTLSISRSPQILSLQSWSACLSPERPISSSEHSLFPAPSQVKLTALVPSAPHLSSTPLLGTLHLWLSPMTVADPSHWGVTLCLWKTCRCKYKSATDCPSPVTVLPNCQFGIMLGLKNFNTAHTNV